MSNIILITGATSGIGRQAAFDLAGTGATLVCVGRNEAKTKSLVDELRAVPGAGEVDLLLGDLSRPADTREVAKGFLAKYDRLDVLFNNAGAYFTERELTPDGLERTFALNHLGYFVLTVLLIERLKASSPARVVSTSSDAHGGGDLAYLDDLQTTSFDPFGFRAYGRSKLANIWFTRELARRLEGSRVIANCFHPGFVASRFAYNNGFLGGAFMTLTRPLQKTVEQGADTGVWLATSPEVTETGGYWFERRRRKGTRAARDAAAPQRLWAASERIVADILGKDWAQLD